MIPVKSKPKLECAIRTPSRENRYSGHKLACTVTEESCGFEISDLIVKRKRKLVELRVCLFDFLFYVIQCNSYGHVRALSIERDVKHKKQTSKNPFHNSTQVYIEDPSSNDFRLYVTSPLIRTRGIVQSVKRKQRR